MYERKSKYITTTKAYARGGKFINTTKSCIMRGGKYISIGCTVCYHICIKDDYRKSCKRGGKYVICTIYADLLTVDSTCF